MVDGSRGEHGSGAGVIIRSPESVEVSYAVKFDFQLTNNQAEYEAFITGLGLAHALQAERVEIRADSQLVCNQLSNQFQVREEKLGLYLKKAKQLVELFNEVEVSRYPGMKITELICWLEWLQLQIRNYLSRSH